MSDHKTTRAKASAQEIKGTSTTTILSRMFRRMMVYVAGTIDVTDDNINSLPVDSSKFMDQMVSFGKYERHMTDFVQDGRNCIPPNKKDQSSARGNLQKEILKADMSWKVFTKGLRFLGVKSFEISITLHHTNGRISKHTDHVNLGSPNRIPTNGHTTDTSKLPPSTGSIFNTIPGIKDSERIFRQATEHLERSGKNI